MREICHLNPINKSTAGVVGQKGCSLNNKLTDEQLRENLVTYVKRLETQIISSRKGSWKRAELGLLKNKVQGEINKLRPKRRSPGVENFFIKAAKETLTKPEYDRVMQLANELIRENLNYDSPNDSP